MSKVRTNLLPALLALSAWAVAPALQAATATFTLRTKGLVSVKLPKGDGCKFTFKDAHSEHWLDASGTSDGRTSGITLGGPSTYKVTIGGPGFIVSCKAKLALIGAKGSCTIQFATGSGQVSFQKKQQKIVEDGTPHLVKIIDDNTIECQ